ncbi:MAG: sodium:solute symporter family transporter [Pseudomonadota bacterium]
MVVDLAIIAVFVAYSIHVGFRSRVVAGRNLGEYFLAGRSVRGWRAGLSMAATQFAADTPLLVMGMLAVGGAASLWRLWIYGLAFLLMGFLLGGAWQRAGVLTDAELTTERYSARGALTLRVLKAVYYGAVVNCVILAFVLVAAVRIFELFLPWHEWLPAVVHAPLVEAVSAAGLVIASGVTGLGEDVATANNLISIAAMLVFVMLYSTSGGLRGVIATDILQMAFMLLGTAAYAWVAVAHAGGMPALLGALESHYGAGAERFVSFAPVTDTATALLVVVSLQWFFQLNSDGTGYLAQRTMACADERQARTAAVVFTFTQVVVRSLLWLVIGLALLVVFPFEPGAVMDEAFVAERELTFARGIDALLPAGLRGLMLTGMLAALASTVDTHLNWGAGYWSNDLYRGWWLEHVAKREPRPRELVRVARLSNVLLIVLALVVMTQLDSIRSGWHLSLLFGAGMGAVLVLRWLWERINLYCEVAAIVASLIAAPILLLTVDDEWRRLALMAGVSTAAVVVAALVMPVTEPHRLQAFYRRVRPPGFWRATAEAVGEAAEAPRRRLLSGTVAIIAAAVSVYGTLVGVGHVLLARVGVDTVVLLAAALVAVPLWLRFVIHGQHRPARDGGAGTTAKRATSSGSWSR